MRSLFLIIVFYLSTIFHLNAQRTQILYPNIHTVQVIVNDNFKLPPIIELNSDDYLDISFDQLSHEYNRYQYVISHCNANWTLSDISEFDYLDGFNNNPIDDFETSVNTTIAYTHYRFQIPNEKIQLKLSGNYEIAIFNEDNLQEPIIKTYFRVSEECVSISASVTSNTDIDFNNNHQQVNFDIHHKGYIIRNPQQELKVHVLQNNRTDNMAKDVLPNYISPDKLQYKHNRALIFGAGNEYRRFEIVSNKYGGMKVESLQYFDPYYHATLYIDELRNNNYIYDEDQNGRFLVRYNDAIDDNIDADYFFVHFMLDVEKTLSNGNIFLEGEFTYDQFNTQTQMKYNASEQCYESVQLLKQGAYNYQYLYVPNGKTKGECGPIEGNFSQTENEYLILVYQRIFGERYDRLIGKKQIRYQ